MLDIDTALLPFGLALVGAAVFVAAIVWRRSEAELERDWDLLLHEDALSAIEEMRALLEAEDTATANVMKVRAADGVDDARRAELWNVGVSFFVGITTSRLQLVRRLRLLSRMVSAVTAPAPAASSKLRTLAAGLEVLLRGPGLDSPARLHALTAAQLEAWRAVVGAIR